MEKSVERQNWKRGVWGVVLIALGVTFLLNQLGYLELRGIAHWWPALLILFGVIRLATLEAPRHLASGIAFILWGLWFFACLQHWYGLTFRTGWPLVLVIVGFETVILASWRRTGRGEQSHV